MRRSAAAALLSLCCFYPALACKDCISRKVQPFKELADKLADKLAQPHPHPLTFCAPGYYDPHTGIGLPMFCEPCGTGYFCEDGATHVPCPAGQTTSTETATSVNDCFNPNPPPPPQSPPQPPPQPPVQPPPQTPPSTPVQPPPQTPPQSPPQPPAQPPPQSPAQPPAQSPPPTPSPSPRPPHNPPVVPGQPILPSPLPPTPTPSPSPRPPHKPPVVPGQPVLPSPVPPTPSPTPPPRPPPSPPTKCNPCAELNPDVLMTTGAKAQPPNGLWRVRKWSPRMDLDPEFLCSIQGMKGMVADIAMRSNGDVFIVDLACNIYFMSDAAYKQLQPTTNWNTTCSPKFLARLSVSGTETCTGISPGLKSNLILLSTNEGYVVQLEVNRKPNGSYEQKEVSRVLAAADPITGVLGTEGGTDVTFGPDGYAYRFTAKDQVASYAATRYPVIPTTGYLVGNFTYTNRDVPAQKGHYSNAGAFCTRDYAVGVAARAEKSERDYASFFAFGVGQPGSTNPAELPLMNLVAQTKALHLRALRVNGATTRPVCGL